MAAGRGGGWRIDRVPVERLPQIEMMPVLALRNPMYAYLEIDVSSARQRLRVHLQHTGERLSFTAFVIACVARAADEHRQVQAFRRGRRLLIFDQVDVATMVEVDANGTRVPLLYVIRDAAARSVAEIHAEIRAVQEDPAPLLKQKQGQIERLRRVPRPLRWLLWRALMRAPRLRRRFGGTVMVTTVGTFGVGRGWGHGLACYPVTVTIGAITPAPHLHAHELDNREQLCLTVSLDHEVVDGGPATRFLGFLQALIEEGEGLDPVHSDPSPGLTAIP